MKFKSITGEWKESEKARQEREQKEAELEALKNENAELKVRLESTEEALLTIMFGNL